MRPSAPVAILIAVGLPAAVAALSGCDRGAPGAPPQLLVFCGAGLRPPVAELAGAFGRQRGVSVVADYAGSEVMLSRIRVGKQGDVYLPGDRHYVDLAEGEGLIIERRPICYFVPVILVPKGNPRGIAGLRDLVRPGLRLGLGDHRACAIGRISRRILAKNRIPWQDVERTLHFQSLTVNELALQIEAGALDAVVVWDAVAHCYEKDADVVAIPAAENIISSVDVAVLHFTRDRKTAEAFVRFLGSPVGLSTFAKHGYRVELPEGLQEPAKG